MRLRTRIFLAAILVTLLAVSIASVRDLAAEASLRRDEDSRRSRAVAESVAAVVVDELSGGEGVDRETLGLFVRTVGEMTPEVISLSIETESGERIASHGPAGGSPPRADASRLISVSLEGSGRAYRLEMVWDESGMRREFARSVIWLISTLLILLLVSGLVSFRLARRITRPIDALGRSMASVRGGDLSVRADEDGPGEIAELAGTFNGMVEGLRERERLRSAFSTYVSRQVMDKIISAPSGIYLGGERRRVTVLFSDIRGFTTLSEHNDPEEIISFLNDYFTIMVGAVFKYEGTLDKFIGDAVMAVFNAPIDLPDPELRAVYAAIEMRAKLSEWSAGRAAEGKTPIRVGIGIHTGEAVAGSVGTEEKMEYTVIGDTVNLAQRIESWTSKLGSEETVILISEEVQRAVEELVSTRYHGTVTVKGRATPVVLYELLEAVSPGL